MPKTWANETSRKRCVVLACVMALGFAAQLYALPERNISLDIGAGLPNTLFAQGEILVSRRIQFGFGYGMIPGADALASGIHLPTQDVDLTGGVQVSVVPSLSATFNSLAPFVRYFPSDNNFYFQGSFTMLQLHLKVSGDLIEKQSGTKVGLIGGNMTVTQPLPTLSVGYVFSGAEYFFNISLGASFFMAALTSVELTGLIPDALGGSEGNAAALDQLKSGLGDGLNSATADFRNTYPVIPSLLISFGFML